MSSRLLKVDFRDKAIIESLLEIERDTYDQLGSLYDVSPWGREQFLLALDGKSKFSFLIVEDKTVGFSIAYRFATGWAHISRFAIAPGLKGQGVGKRLISGQLAAMKTADFKLCSVDVVKENIAAINLYKKFGFKELGDGALEAYVEVRSREPSEYLGRRATHTALKLFF